MIIKNIEPSVKRNIEGYARYLANYMASGDRRLLKPDAIGFDHGLTLSAYIGGDSAASDVQNDRVLYRGGQIAGASSKWDECAAEAFRRLQSRSRKVKKPVRHAIVSCREDEQMSHAQCHEAVAMLADELGCEDAAILWAAHTDTDNFHLHIMFVNVDAETGTAIPFGEGPNGSAQYKEAMQRALTRMEHSFKLQPEAGARYEMSGDKVVRKPVHPAIVRKRSPIKTDVLAWENQSGFVSFTRYAQETAGPVLDDSTSWQALHLGLANAGIGIRPAVNGGELYAGDDHVKLSNIDRRHSWPKLVKRIGPFEPPVDVGIAQYTPRIADTQKAKAWMDRERTLRSMSERVDQRISALMLARDAAISRTNETIAAYRDDIAGFDGDAQLKRDIAAAWPRIRATATTAIKAAFAARIDAVRGLRHAAAVCDDLGGIDLDALGSPDAGVVQSWHASPAPLEVEMIAGFVGDRSGSAVRYWSETDHARRGQPAFVDAGAIIWVNASTDETIKAVLLLAQKRFGKAAVFGDRTYLRQCYRVANELGMEIETITISEAKRRARNKSRRSLDGRQRAINAEVERKDRQSAFAQWARAYRQTVISDDAPHAEQITGPNSSPRHHTDIGEVLVDQIATLSDNSPPEPARVTEKRRGPIVQRDGDGLE